MLAKWFFIKAPWDLRQQTQFSFQLLDSLCVKEMLSCDGCARTCIMNPMVHWEIHYAKYILYKEMLWNPRGMAAVSVLQPNMF